MTNLIMMYHICFLKNFLRKYR